MAAAEHPSVASLLQQPSTHQVSPPPSNGSDSLVCHWVGCGEHASSPEALYEHVCERHVGRKSTNNLNLQCQWGSCRTTTVKRDHITSHIRVHVPLKPHKCDFCGKSFKRPQDLKKHVKTHADDSILLRSPGANGVQHGYHQGIAKGTSAYDGALRNALTKLSAQAGNGYYSEAATGGAGGPYGYNQAYPHNGIAAQAGAVHGYGGASSYAIPNVNLADGGAVGESRKRGHDMLEQFFSDAKRRQIDANNYMDLGARFGGLHGLQMGLAPGLGGYNMGYGGINDDYGSTAAAMAQYSHASQPYAMFNELKTKSDLMSIDHFLEQLQNTVYENPGRSSSTNIQPGLDAMGPSQGATPSYSDSRAPSLVEDTPTPASNYSTNSPASVHSSFNNRSSGTAYPQLPSVSALAEMQPAGFNGSGMPSSGIAEYDSGDNRRRFSSNFLQRANLPKIEKEDAHSPSSTRSDEKDAQPRDLKKASSLSPKEDSNVTLPPIRHAEADRSEEERNEAWVENMRVIEHLRHYIQDRLKHNEFDDGEGRSSSEGNRDGETTPRANRSPESKDVEMTDREKEAGSLYPVLRAVQAAD